MGKKRIVKKGGGGADAGLKSRSLSRLPKKKVESGVLHIEATYNNTKISLLDRQGNMIMWSSSGSLGFKGAKKGTPFAAAKVGELLGEKASLVGLREVGVVIKGVGSGRESAVRSFASKGIQLTSIKDTTPVPHNGPRPKKPRRV
jgi:small subunit ribosomal protein S11